MNFVPPNEPRAKYIGTTTCKNCGAPGQHAGRACAYCAVVVEVAATVRIRPPPVELPETPRPPVIRE